MTNRKNASGHVCFWHDAWQKEQTFSGETDASWTENGLNLIPVDFQPGIFLTFQQESNAKVRDAKDSDDFTKIRFCLIQRIEGKI